jgi:hypothetical protein
MVSTAKNTSSSIGEVDSSLLPSSLTIKLAVTNTALRYFVVSNTFKQVVYFSEYALHHVTGMADLGKRIEKIYARDEILQMPVSGVLVGSDSKYGLVPTELSFMTAPNKFSQKCAESGLEIIFDRNEELIEIISGMFPSPRFLHLNSSFIHLLPQYQSEAAVRVFLNVSPGHFDIIHFSNDKKLKMMNRYEFKTETDFIYFLLLYCDEMKLDRETLELILIGEIDIQSKIYDMCYRYFKNIGFIKNTGITFSKAFERYHKHLHFNLYNLAE